MPSAACNDTQQSYGFNTGPAGRVVTGRAALRGPSRNVRRAPLLLCPAPRVATTGLIRYRLLSIVLLGVVTSALSLFVLERAVSTSMSVRRGRARDIVTAEVDRLAATTPSPAALEAGSVSAFVGVRGGWVDDPADVARAPNVPAAWVPTLVDTLARAAAEPRRASIGELDQSPNTLIVAAAPAQGGAWRGWPTS